MLPSQPRYLGDEISPTRSSCRGKFGSSRACLVDLNGAPDSEMKVGSRDGILRETTRDTGMLSQKVRLRFLQ